MALPKGKAAMSYLNQGRTSFTSGPPWTGCTQGVYTDHLGIVVLKEGGNDLSQTARLSHRLLF